MKKEIEKAKNLYQMTLNMLELLGDQIMTLEKEFNGIDRRLSPKRLPGNLGGVEPANKLPSEVAIVNRREGDRSSKAKGTANLADWYIKVIIKQTVAWKKNPVEITNQMIEVKREQLKLKRGIHEQEQITQEKLEKDWA